MLSIVILSTSKRALICDCEVWKTNLGGREILCQVYGSQIIIFLEIIGIGHKASTNLQGSIVYLKLDFSHKIWLQVMFSIHNFCFKPNPICCIGIDHQKVIKLMYKGLKSIPEQSAPLTNIRWHHKDMNTWNQNFAQNSSNFNSVGNVSYLRSKQANARHLQWPSSKKDCFRSN